MSVELPEATILADQMNKEIKGKRIKSYVLRDYGKLQKLGFINKDVSYFEQLVNRKVEAVRSRGNVIHVKLDAGVNLILGPEYGGRILYHLNQKTIPESFHLMIQFNDGTSLTVRLTGMGAIQVFKDDALTQSYVYKRDFSNVPSPINEDEFTFSRFSALLAEKNSALKSALVGKDALVVGLGNSSFQDILYRAKIYPKRKTSDLDEKTKRALYDAIRFVMLERIRLGGKTEFLDLYGKQGRYTPAIGPKQQACPSCGTLIQKLSLGGGITYFCPRCQE